MESQKTIQRLMLSIQQRKTLSDIVEFDGHSGRLDKNVNLTGYVDGQIVTDDNRILWSGTINFRDKARFDLCIVNSSSSSKEIINWKDLPPFFSIFDGGYEALLHEEVNNLLDDLVEFEELVKIRCHFERDGKFHSLDGVWGNQESLKEIAEIFIEVENGSNLASHQPVLIEIELFETVYFAIALYEEGFEDGFILSLTSHFYQQRNRVGRRIPIKPMLIGNYRVLEVSDFGMKVETKGESDLNVVILEVENYQLTFRVIYRSFHDGVFILGLHLEDYAPQARKAWQRFLLPIQYPLLKYRTLEDHECFWNLYYETGFMNFPYTEMVRQSKDSIFRTWGLIDEKGPDLGASIIGFDQNKAISSIGVARAAKNVWVAQAANAIAEPKYLPFTRSMYSWRTRFILQQIDGDYHLAFLHRDKKFLDRFFRKFFLLQQGTMNEQYITWNEWNMFVARNPCHDRTAIADSEQVIDFPIENQFVGQKLFERFLNAGNETLSMNTVDGAILSANLPHLHMTQYLTSIWLHSTKRVSAENAKRIFNENQPFFSIYSPDNDLEKLSAFKSDPSFELIHEGWHVVWTCHRVLLSAFLKNSLRSLEQMNRKYGGKSVA